MRAARTHRSVLVKVRRADAKVNQFAVAVEYRVQKAQFKRLFVVYERRTRARQFKPAKVVNVASYKERFFEGVALRHAKPHLKPSVIAHVTRPLVVRQAAYVGKRNVRVA